ncbi:MAG: VPLPA-CTERM sorting domain-containing protein, partial [Gammaproteobacteria bacterium]|nr:VPLPA-CTERM sorting domain-containing protein [Gammaproteobacteria bacterium]
MKHVLSSAVAVAITAMLAVPQADAIPIRSNPGFATSSLAANDDDSTGLVNLGISANFFGTTYTSAYINNNGNITFDSALWTYTPFPIVTTGEKLIAPFFADVDTRAGALMTYGTDTVGGR